LKILEGNADLKIILGKVTQTEKNGKTIRRKIIHGKMEKESALENSFMME